MMPFSKRRHNCDVNVIANSIKRKNASLSSLINSIRVSDLNPLEEKKKQLELEIKRKYEEYDDLVEEYYDYEYKINNCNTEIQKINSINDELQKLNKKLHSLEDDLKTTEEKYNILQIHSDE